MAINKTTTETKNKIKANSVIALPNRPQIPAEQLKQAFVKPIVDTSNSMIQELDRIVEETNAELEQVQVNITNAIGEHNTNTEATHLDIRQEIADLDNDLQGQIDVIDDTLQNHESRIGELEQFAENLETNITEEIEGAVSTHNTNELAHPFLIGKIDEARAIAEGKVSAMSFETKADLDAWLEISENVETLLVGTNFYIEDLASPDYWWNGTTLVELSTEKIDLTDYVKSEDLATVALTGSYNDLTDKPTIPTVPTISTNITTDETSDTKTVSPKAVKTYVDNAISNALDNLLGGEY